jgi:type 1 glutamine amidotransferase
MRKLALAVAVIAALAPMAVPAASGQAMKKKYRILFITQSKGFMHGSVRRPAPDKLAPAETSVTELAASSGLFDVECTQDASVLTPEKMQSLDAVMFYTTGDLPIKDQFPQFEAWLQSGKAMIGTHRATDTLGGFKGYYSLINGTFDGHPWGSGETVTIRNHELSHPAVKPWGEEFQIKDEIYQYRNYDPTSVRVLYSLDMAKCNTKKPYHVPVAWVR